MEKILVTGGAGYVGCHLVPMLLDKGYEVTIIDKLMFGADGLLHCIAHKNLTFIKGDVRDEKLLKKELAKADIIIHLAAIVGFPACKQDPELAMKINFESTKFIVDNMTDEQLLVFASTGSVYGAVTDALCTEETPMNPLTVYGETKAECEKYIFSSDKKAIAYRFATAFGISPRMRIDLMVNDFTYMIMNNNLLNVFEKNFKRTFIDVYDMARSFVFAIENKEKMIGEVYNVGSDTMNYSKEEIAKMIAEHNPGCYLNFAEFGTDEDKRNYEVSYKKINDVGFFTKNDIKEGIGNLVKVMPLMVLKSRYRNV